eukprot:CAMPEP_0185706336 /NCGR_PEP_ID=MMETSP1164-20130828/21705_1 /TAXON_ID=1104430 /ORGANISM="Chrysoreinhardia sp, Strain CCMP2950" /LENGTH=200 /DNA_ID=CAMNT_0028373739 /DNA_START=32 /DNA_END=634 /DNA_ORIENTATION=-
MTFSTLVLALLLGCTAPASAFFLSARPTTTTGRIQDRCSFETDGRLRLVVCATNTEPEWPNVTVSNADPANYPCETAILAATVATPGARLTCRYTLSQPLGPISVQLKIYNDDIYPSEYSVPVVNLANGADEFLTVRSPGSPTDMQGVCWIRNDNGVPVDAGRIPGTGYLPADILGRVLNPDRVGDDEPGQTGCPSPAPN